MTEEGFCYEYQDKQLVILGHGAGGVTYKGWYMPEGADGKMIPAALKQVVGPNWGGYSLTREVSLLAQTKPLQNPYLVKYLALFYPHTAPLIVTEFVEGITLQAEVENSSNKGVLSSPEWIRRVLTWGRHLASALHQVHELRIRHHDVKPNNVMIRSCDQTPVLIDFGIGRQVGIQPELTARNFLGAPAFASPEQFCTGRSTCEGCRENASSCELTYKTDVYGLGSTLWFALTNQHPFPPVDKDGDLRPLAHAKRQGVRDPSPLPDIPGLQALIVAMLAGNPAQRPAATEVETAISVVIDGLPPISAGFETLPAASSPPRSHTHFQLLPKFVPLDANKEIAVSPLQIFTQTYWVPELKDRIDFDESKTSPARMSYEAAEHIVAVINRDSSESSRGWKYRLPKQGEWMRGAGYLADDIGGGRRIFPRLYREMLELEYEWTDEPGGMFPECRAVRYLEGDHWRATERHRKWPKGVVRLIRERR
jgi:serine/threonine protein kinase